MYGSDGFLDDESLKKNIEVMRGLPFKVYERPQSDNCIEASDAEQLCRNPVVSVIMITYNHEPFISQAIEGIVNQKTDFEFELIISEDRSTDRTREICLEYQKKYPKIIRVLYAEKNTREVYGRIMTGWRARRVKRADFVALCEGDDFWTDPYKLQKQVDVFRNNPSVQLCYTRTRILIDATGDVSEPKIGVKPGLIKGEDFWRAIIYRRGTKIYTCSVMYKSSAVEQVYAKLRFPTWDLNLGDVPLFITCAKIGDIYLLDDFCCTYRINSGSIIHSLNGLVGVDNDCVSAYLSYLYWHMPLSKFPLLAHSFRDHLVRIAKGYLPGSRVTSYKKMFETNVYLPVIMKNPLVLLYVPLSWLASYSIRIEGLIREGLWKTIKTQINRRILKR